MVTIETARKDSEGRQIEARKEHDEQEEYV